MDDFTDLSQFRIGDLLVVPRQNIFIRDWEEIPVQPRMMAALILVAEEAGKVISFERLLITIWGADFYGENFVQKAISSLRKSIGDSVRKPRYIETLSEIDYRLTIPAPYSERQPPTCPQPASYAGASLSRFH